MSDQISSWKEMERFIGGMKFAVVLIALFSFAMIIGTFVESYYGTEFANRLIYKAPFFMVLQLSLFLSILMAMLNRLPPKRRLGGFYLVHTGLVLIGCGSFVTYYAGIDGHITLLPNTPTREITLSQDIIRVRYPAHNEEYTLDLPYTAFNRTINQQMGPIVVKRFAPFSDTALSWSEESRKKSHQSWISASYQLESKMMPAPQQVLLSMHPQAAGVNSAVQLGPLELHLLPPSMEQCLLATNRSGLMLIDVKDHSCFTPESRSAKHMKSATNKNILVVTIDNHSTTFLPDESPFPVDAKTLKLDPTASLRVLDRKEYRKRTALYLFGNSLTFYDKKKERWISDSFKQNSRIALPWMDFSIRKTKVTTTSYPRYAPVPSLPLQQNGKLVKGREKAALIVMSGEEHWLSSSTPLYLKAPHKHEGEKEVVYENMIVSIEKSKLSLPFSFTLDRFKMDKNPGTNMPASFESYVNLLTPQGLSVEHIFMNNPLKHHGFTFYQSSYFPSEGGSFASVLSANVDPGRGLKYFGSLLLVLGAVVHYLLNHRIIKKRG
ncbi:MAG: hypothetical protein HN353_12185 [Bdellovibrionales bacterium]|nr:hypothetical protein [Bdellovibrionales bacterium]MBT3526145.1 hypothetical protein [Bdellovibrionales bacterium]MBT7768210.1 hypothetical protein [Bdellovibrionales bacterium]